jgi:hypothetical protein
MMVRVEDGNQVPDQTIVADFDSVIGNDRGTSVDENAFAEHKGAMFGSAQLDWYRLTPQEQASARD